MPKKTSTKTAETESVPTPVVAAAAVAVKKEKKPKAVKVEAAAAPVVSLKTWGCVWKRRWRMGLPPLKRRRRWPSFYCWP
jgi:hypothetical protein